MGKQFSLWKSSFYWRPFKWIMLLFLLLPQIVSAQNDLVRLEKKLVFYIQQQQKFRRNNFDSLDYYSNLFSREMTRAVKADTNTLRFPFQKLQDMGCHIYASSDRNFRIYSWNTNLGGTMHFYRSIYQWRSRKGLHTTTLPDDENDPGEFCSKIFQINIQGITHYLAVLNGIYSSKDVMVSVTAYQIDSSGKLQLANIFPEKNRWVSTLSIELNWLASLDKRKPFLPLIRVDEKTKKSYLPIADDTQALTKKDNVFVLREGRFQFVTIAKSRYAID